MWPSTVKEGICFRKTKKKIIFQNWGRNRSGALRHGPCKLRDQCQICSPRRVLYHGIIAQARMQGRRSRSLGGANNWKGLTKTDTWTSHCFQGKTTMHGRQIPGRKETPSSTWAMYECCRKIKSKGVRVGEWEMGTLGGPGSDKAYCQV